MPRKKRVVEGLVLDLRGLEGESVDIEALLQAEERKREVKKSKSKEVKPVFNIDLFINNAFNHIRTCKFCNNKLLNNDICTECCNNIKQANMSKMIDYLNKKGMTKCNLCGIPRGNDCIGFHFDHINMFNKSDSVGSMVRRSYDMNLIMAEIDKCQLLCISCHELITKIEQKHGFITSKIRLTRGISKRPISELEAEYTSIMTPIYDNIRAKWEAVGWAGGGGCSKNKEFCE